jgi:hypothetical protein
MAEFSAETYLRMHSKLRTDREPIESIWRACYEVTFPERADGFDGTAQTSPDDTQRKRSELLDSTLTDAARMLASQTHSGMTPANSVWALLDVGEESDDERRWLDHAAHVMWEQIHGANYDSQKFEAVLDAVIAGWFVLMIDEDHKGALHFQQLPLSQCFVSASRAGGMIDTLFRYFKLTATQAVNEYGEANVPEKIRECASGDKGEDKFSFVHVIRPRKKVNGGGMMGKNLPIESVHVCLETKTFVRDSGYHEQPFAAPRWMQLPNSVYAVGPVAQALPVARRLNKLLELEESALARAAAGVYVAEDDGVLNPRAVKVRGGSVIVANSVDSIKPLPSGADFNVSFTKAEQLRAEIRRIMLADQLQPQDGPAMTATEVHVRVQLIRQLMGPLYGRFQNEDLSVTIDRVFGLLYRRGRPEIGGKPGQVVIDDAPDSLADTVFSVRYQSPLARAQKLEDVTAIERTAVFVQQLVAGGSPEAGDLLDTDEAVRLHAEGTGAPDKVIRDTKSVLARREARIKAEQEAQEQAQQQQMQTMAMDGAVKRSVAAV